MKKAIALLLSVTMTAALAIGGTLAYLTDTDEDVNVMTVGKVKIDQLEYERVDVESTDDNAVVQEFHDNKPLYPAVTEDGFEYVPGDTYVDWDQIGKDGYTSKIWDPTKINNEVDKMVFVKNKGDFDAYVRTVFAFEAGSYTSLDAYLADVHLNLNTTDFTWEWVQTPVTIGEGTYFVAVATYNEALTPGALTEISLSQIALDSSVTNEDVLGFGDTFQVLVQSQAVQAAGFDTPAAALEAAFGEIPPQYPFEGDNATKGTDVYTALNYLDGGTEKITNKVSNIIFGRTEDYADVALQNKGTLVDVNQDVPVYAYYVPNNGNYDVYLLGSDTIYAPVDCSNLCNGMSSLVTFDTTNLDFSRTTSMYRMLRDCGKLANIEVSDWDTSNVTNMRDLFRGCKAIPALDVSKWETGNVTTMVAMFQDCVLISELDLNSWDVSNVVETIQMFNRCSALVDLKIDQWKPKSLAVSTTMFQFCTNLRELDLSGWITPSLTTSNGMFNHCESLTMLDVSTWDVSNVEDLSLMFQSCLKLEELDLTDWELTSAKNMNSFLFNCTSLVEFDTTGWDTSSITNFTQMFVNCKSLEIIYGMDGWNTANGTNFSNMFAGCFSLKVLDLSSFDTRNATAMADMVYEATALEKLILGENFVRTGNGNLSATRIPAPGKIEGSDGKWYDIETGIGYLPADIPAGAGTYVAVMP